MSQLEVLKQDSVSISTVNAGTGSRENGITIFEMAILEITEFYGVEWRNEVIRETAEMLNSDYYWFSLAELKHFVIKVKKAQFKPLEDYSKLSPKHLLQCSAIYANDCLFARANFNFPKPVREDSNESANMVEVDVLAVFKETLKEMIEKDRAEDKRKSDERKERQRVRLLSNLEALKDSMSTEQYDTIKAEIENTYKNDAA